MKPIEVFKGGIDLARQMTATNHTVEHAIGSSLEIYCRWFHDRHRAVQSMHHQLTDAVHLVILKCVEKCGYITVNPVGWNVFSINRSGKQWIVDLAWKTYTCVDFYKRQTLIDTYSVPIMPIGHPFSWVVPVDIAERVVLNPLSRRQAGCLRGSRHASYSERTTTQSCKRCGQSGHNARRCPNPPLSSNGPSKVIPMNTAQV
ncbi:hypothetical protein Ddye_025920 [Dipteronia dyeriana]|uniref:CCHC-type domain-containing protein n=1 Tax=Dipteronia dyeriana TaxID=168575 RepID=A0AAD9TMB6_9ROSI|nr:hypothetical protein Ddye_025920 [Dipteronia dyeriana]